MEWNNACDGDKKPESYLGHFFHLTLPSGGLEVIRGASYIPASVVKVQAAQRGLWAATVWLTLCCQGSMSGEVYFLFRPCKGQSFFPWL